MEGLLPGRDKVRAEQDAAGATWIWYPGDFELGLHYNVSIRRQERNNAYPPPWRLDSFYGSVKFYKTVDLAEDEEVLLACEGEWNVSLDGVIVYDAAERLVIPAGKHEVIISVANRDSVPAIYMQGKTLRTDRSWLVSCNSRKWAEAGHWNFNRAEDRPSGYKLETTEIEPVHCEGDENERKGLADFGRETFGYVRLRRVRGQGKVTLYYGESLEEAEATAACETLDRSELNMGDIEQDYTIPASRAFRYVHYECESGVQIGGISALYEYLPLDYRGKFRCSDPQLNDIWDVAAYTLHLTTREFFLDGIKRDRWVWSGDVYQSVLMNFYLFFDADVNRRTLIAVRGKDPVETHLNHILDYSFYWFLALYDHYQYTGDVQLIRQLYDKIGSLLDYCLQRRNENGMAAGLPGDWVFVDWAEMDNGGEVCFEQVLLCRSLEVMAEFADLMNDALRAQDCRREAAMLKKRVLELFWDDELGGLIHSRKDGKPDRHMTRYANMFALMLGYLDESQAASVKDKVLLNEQVQKIKTPYMRFYELASLCEIGEHAHVTDEIRSYWGGMLKLGATSFWEEYDPQVQGSDHYAMYSRPFGKSLCHAWGASPLYLLGKYYLGIKPVAPGYAKYYAEPQLGGLDWIEGVIPMPGGQIEVYMDSRTIKLTASSGEGVLRFRSDEPPSCLQGTIIEIDPDQGTFELQLEPGTTYEVSCKA
ncbi:alpha-rhamnosidase [Paenibacillus sp. GCM10027626]|uniref:alpha-L-rhamnosidase-related protein n=1 Tax=Paenibacillus sp. GCM10027626 TaxID=3273411 RepID=UPI0036290D02